MVVPILGSVLLILIAGLNPKRKPALIRCLIYGSTLSLIWVIAIQFLAPLVRSFPDAATSRVAKFGVERVKAGQASLGQYVLVIEGSSPTSRAVDGDLLESQLRAAGIAASVIQIALDGANHVERLQILRQFVQGLGATEVERLKQARVILCREIEFNYDRDPFNKVESNAFSDRTLSYINVQNLPEIVRWFELNSGWKGLLRKRDLIGSLAAMEAFNLFRVGYLERIERGSSLPPQNGFLPREVSAPDFNPNGPLPVSVPVDSSKSELKLFRSLAPWVAARDAEYASLFEKIGVTPFFFSVTTWHASMLRYNAWLVQSTRPRYFFNGDTEALRQSLADPQLWADELHLRPAGARIYTLAFANYFINAIRHREI